MTIDWRSATLAVLIVPLLPISILLWRRWVERRAAGFLVALFAAWSLLCVPYMIGFSGAYDAFPWLTFAPFNTEAWLGPLIFLYASALTRTTAPPRARLLLAPGAVITAYYTGCFVLLGSAENKFAFTNAVHQPYVYPVETLIGLALAAYGVWAAWRAIGAYRSWLAGARADYDAFDLAYLRGFLVTVVAVVALWIVFDLVELLVGGIPYAQAFWVYVVVGIAVLGLGLDALTRVDRVYPKMDAEPVRVDAAALGRRTPPPPSLPDLAGRIRQEGWARDANLTIGALSRRVGVNESALSAAINERADMNFNTMINALRVEDACAALLAAPPDRTIYEIALDCGFGSKATFNRVFRERVGMTPSQWRRAGSTSQIPQFAPSDETETPAPPGAAKPIAGGEEGSTT
ncbi:MAG: helix-turn-helix domain-containing protein [Pseudomonadota bacterium]